MSLKRKSLKGGILFALQTSLSICTQTGDSLVNEQEFVAAIEVSCPDVGWWCRLGDW